MRIKLKIITNKRTLPVNLNQSIISYFKYTLKKYNTTLYESFYKNSNAAKPFAFALYLPGAECKEDIISISENRFNILITACEPIAIELYNAFLKTKGELYHFGDTSGICEEISIETTEEIKSNKVVIKFLSPLVLREHVRGYDRYITANDECFNDAFKEIINYQLKLFEHKEDTEISIKPVKEKVVVKKIFGINIPGSIGAYILKGNKEAINILYEMGAGSRRSEGFGLFDIVMEVIE